LSHTGEQTPEPDVPPPAEDHGRVRLRGGGRVRPALLPAQAAHFFALFPGRLPSHPTLAPAHSADSPHVIGLLDGHHELREIHQDLPPVPASPVLLHHPGELQVSH